uniref:Uncharacterized protein n=1 Tax=Megaselia scalaris TaxID=36166 RepID=T1GK86_MEGSC
TAHPCFATKWVFVAFYNQILEHCNNIIRNIFIATAPQTFPSIIKLINSKFIQKTVSWPLSSVLVTLVTVLYVTHKIPTAKII